jgi:hypothetical protein
VAELAHHHIEGPRLERQVFDVPFVPVDLHRSEARVLACNGQ